MEEFFSQEALASFIDNRLALLDKKPKDIISSVNGRMFKKLHFIEPAQVDQAIASSVKAFADLKKTSAYFRAQILLKTSLFLEAYKEPLARLMTIEMGKTINEARAEVDYSAGFFSWYANEAIRIYGYSIPAISTDKHLSVEYAPVGVCGLITPWNFPLAMGARKIAPALAAGCTAIIKPAPETPCTMLALAFILKKAGLPSGCVNVLVGDDEIMIGKKMLEADVVRKLSFTGSSAVGQYLYMHCASTLKRVTLELGGLAPLIVFDDADLDIAEQETLKAKFRNMGQSCIGANRLFVQKGIYDKFLERFIKKVESLRVGDPFLEETEISNVLHPISSEKVIKHVTDAVQKGAKHVVKGQTPATPHLLTGCTPDMAVFKEETFGPVVAIASFTTEEEAFKMANATPFGLAAYVFTRDLSRARRAIQALDCGIIGLNDGLPSCPQAPFGGIKHSGLGREGGRSGIYEYLDEKYISQKF